jgi:hypothetical protein
LNLALGLVKFCIKFLQKMQKYCCDSLVKFAKQIGSCTWLGYVPEPIASAVSLDLQFGSV